MPRNKLNKNFKTYIRKNFKRYLSTLKTTQGNGKAFFLRRNSGIMSLIYKAINKFISTSNR